MIDNAYNVLLHGQHLYLFLYPFLLGSYILSSYHFILMELWDSHLALVLRYMESILFQQLGQQGGLILVSVANLIYIAEGERGPPLKERLCACIFQFETGEVCSSLHKRSKLQRLGQKL